MALTITINLNDSQEAVLNRMTDEHNRSVSINNQNPPDPLTPTQFVRQILREKVEVAERVYDQQDRERLRDLYQQATPEDQATIDGILDKYRN